MTEVYFVRHAKPDFSIHDDLTRPLNEEGIKDCKRVTKFLINKNIDKVFSSPYKRAFDTVKDFADKSNLEIDIIDDFRERAISDGWIKDFNTFAARQWENFDHSQFQRIKNLMPFIVCIDFQGTKAVNIEEYYIYE